MKKQVKITDTGNRKEVAQFLEKIVIDIGVGRASAQPNFNEKVLPKVTKDLSLLSGQRPQYRPAKKSISGFKVRVGQVVGLRTTLRRKKAVDFFERLIKIVLPRVRDFRGLRLQAVDGGGVLNIGLKEQYVFPEIIPEESPYAFSLGISVVPHKRLREEAVRRYRELGVPLRK